MTKPEPLTCPYCRGTGLWKNQPDEICNCCQGAKAFEPMQAVHRDYDYFSHPKWREKVSLSAPLSSQRDALRDYYCETVDRNELSLKAPYLLPLYDEVMRQRAPDESEIIAIARAIIDDAPKTIRDQRTVQIDVQLLARLAEALQDFDARGW